MIEAASPAVSASIIAVEVPSSPLLNSESSTRYLSDPKQGLGLFARDQLL